MKTILKFLMVAVMLFTATQVDAQLGRLRANNSPQTFISADSLNDISGADTTHYWVVDDNSDWCATITTASLVGTKNSTAIVYWSTNGSNWAISDTANNSSWAHTLSADSTFYFTGTTCPAPYMAIKITKGSVTSGIYTIIANMKP